MSEARCVGSCLSLGELHADCTSHNPARNDVPYRARVRGGGVLMYWRRKGWARARRRWAGGSKGRPRATPESAVGELWGEGGTLSEQTTLSAGWGGF